MFTEKCDPEKLNMVEIGPRFCLNPVKILDGCMSGETIWQNENFITPNALRSKKYANYTNRLDAKDKRKKKLKSNVLEETDLDRAFD